MHTSRPIPYVAGVSFLLGVTVTVVSMSLIHNAQADAQPAEADGNEGRKVIVSNTAAKPVPILATKPIQIANESANGEKTPLIVTVNGTMSTVSSAPTNPRWEHIFLPFSGSENDKWNVISQGHKGYEAVTVAAGMIIMKKRSS